MANKRFVDYAFKSYVLNSHGDLVLRQKRCSKYDYAINKLIQTGEISPVLRNNNKDVCSTFDLSLECESNGLAKELEECKRINHATYNRVKRLKDRIENILTNGECLFITLTFNDEALNNTTDKQRRTAVSRYLKQYNCKYVANIDFGSKNHREHYHALLNTSKIDFNSWHEKYGAIQVERVRNRNIDNDKNKLAKYIAKLTNHAIKETTKRTALVYSR